MKRTIAIACVCAVTLGCGGDDASDTATEGSTTEGSAGSSTAGPATTSQGSGDTTAGPASTSEGSSAGESTSGGDSTSSGDSTSGGVSPGEPPEISYLVGSCDALLDPMDLSTQANRDAAAQMVAALDPVRVLQTLSLPASAGLPSSWDAAAPCVEVFMGVGSSWEVVDADGCVSEDGATWWGSTRVDVRLQGSDLEATAFSRVSPSGRDTSLVQLDGQSHLSISGYGVGNPPFRGSSALYARTEGVGEGAWYIAFDKPVYGAPATGYLYHYEGDGPLGDFCFTAEYQGLFVPTVTFD